MNVFHLPDLARRWGRNWAFGLFAFVSGCTSLQSASPRNAVFGHAIGIAAGYLSLVIFGLTAGLMALALMGGVVVIVAEGFLLDRLAGLRYPAWRIPPENSA